VARYHVVMGPRHAMTATAENNLATALTDLGLLDEGAVHLGRALAAFRDLVGPRDAKMAVLLGNLGHLRHTLGDVAGALDLYREARDIAVEALGARHPYTAIALNNLAAAQLSAGVIAEGEAGYALAARIWADVSGPEHPNTLVAEINVAEAIRRAGRLEEARARWEGLLPRVVAALGDASPTTSGLLNNLGAVTDQLGDHAAASALLRRAVDARSQTLGVHHPLTALTTTNLVMARWADGDLASAKALQASAMASLQAYFQANVDAADSDLAILDFLRTVRAPFDTSLALWTEGREARDAFAQALVWQGAATRAETLWRDLRRLELGAPDAVVADLAQWRGVRRARLTEPDAPPPKLLSVLERRLTSALPAFAARRERAAPTVAAVCQLLARQRATLVDFVAYDRLVIGAADDPGTRAVDERYTPSYAAFVVDGGCRLRRLDLGPQREVDDRLAALQHAVDEAITCLGKRGAGFCGPALTAADAAGTAVREVLWEPLGVKATRGARVWVVPDGRIATVSFETLADARGRYLLEDAEIAYLPYPSALLAAAPRGVTSGAWIGGDVNYRRAAPAPEGAASTLRAAGTGVCGYGASWPDLTPTEVTAIAGQLRGALGGGATLVTGDAATEAAARAAMPGKRVIHLATHGFFSPAAACDERQLPLDKALDPLRLSAVVLAGADRALTAPDLASDGILSAREVVGLDLRGTEVVTLSACETGRGMEVAGEGVQGLGRAFLVAGARTVIVSLWRVPSEETGRLFERFYRRAFAKTGAASPPAALREAQLSLLADLRAEGIAHSAPLWGAFIAMVGAGR
jgi:CHAT domain-containing protein/tetratricopeptide (TPR) repeat protein